MTADTKAIRARIHGCHPAGQSIRYSPGDSEALALCDRIEALENVLRRIAAIAIAGRAHHPAFDNIADVATYALRGP